MRVVVMVSTTFNGPTHSSPASTLFEVADNGTGIPTTEKRKIFEKFYRVGSEMTRKTKGTGLGLFIVAQIVKLHNGVISVADNAPKGTVFKIVLPS